MQDYLPSKPYKPSEPIKPHRPVKPKTTEIRSVKVGNVATYRDFDKYLERLRHIKEKYPDQKLKIYDDGIYVDKEVPCSKRDYQNLIDWYEQGMEHYKQNMSSYKESMVKYKERLQQYEEDMEVYKKSYREYELMMLAKRAESLGVKLLIEG
jgi:uncharacterized protein YozE (UPF0346 family)